MTTSPPPACARPPRILAIDDDPDIRELLRATFEDEPFELIEATHGDAGLALARQLRPALVLLDVMMPGQWSGIEVCRQLKSDPATAAIAVVLLSAHGYAEDLRAGRAAGCDAYVVKPFSPRQLLATVVRLLAAARSHC